MEFRPEQEKESATHLSDQSSYAVDEHIDGALPAQPAKGVPKNTDVIADTMRRFLPGIEVVEEDGMIILRERET